MQNEMVPSLPEKIIRKWRGGHFVEDGRICLLLSDPTRSIIFSLRNSERPIH